MSSNNRLTRCLFVLGRSILPVRTSHLEPTFLSIFDNLYLYEVFPYFINNSIIVVSNSLVFNRHK